MQTWIDTRKLAITQNQPVANEAGEVEFDGALAIPEAGLYRILAVVCLTCAGIVTEHRAKLVHNRFGSSGQQVEVDECFNANDGGGSVLCADLQCAAGDEISIRLDCDDDPTAMLTPKTQMVVWRI
jgi:hypothetical protein